MLKDPHGLEGQELNGYRIESLIGRGAVGLVYRARHLQLSVPRALKFLDPDLVSDTRFLKKFRDEAQALARSESQHIVKVHDLNDSEYGPYIVMEFVEGGTLDDYIRDSGKLAWTETVNIVRQVLAALDRAHGAGVVHRDIKPGNIMIVTEDSGPLVKVTDFGLAIVNRMSDETVAIGEDVTGGTPPYMSPEQSLGGMVDERTDIHAVGVLAYLMFTGQKPYTKETMAETLDAIRTEAPPSLKAAFPAVPQELDSVVRRAMAKRPEDRYRSARDMSDALGAIVDSHVSGGSASRSSSSRSSSSRSDDSRRDGSTSDDPTRHDASRQHLDSSDHSTGAGSTPGRGSKQSDGNAGIRVPVRLLGAIAALAILAVVAWFALIRSDERMIVIDSTPQGAELSVNGDRVGTTPVSLLRSRYLSGDNSVAELRFTTSNGLCCIPLDTTVLFADEDTVVTVVSLRRYGLLSIQSTPVAASVTVNGAPLGVTPLSEKITPGAKTVEIAYNGNTETKQVVILAGDSLLVNADLNTSPAGTQSASPATVTIDAPDNVTVSVAGKSRTGTSSFSVPGGRHTIRWTHPVHGVFEQRFTLLSGRSRTIAIHYVQDVSIQTVTQDGQSLWATILLNGQPSETTPRQLGIEPPGNIVSVQRNGYEVVGVLVNDQRQAGNEVSIKVPTLETERVRLTFELKQTDQ